MVPLVKKENGGILLLSPWCVWLLYSVEGERAVAMLAVMARIRLIIDTEEVIRLAVKLAATKQGKSPSELVNEILTVALKGEIADAKKYVPKAEAK